MREREQRPHFKRCCRIGRLGTTGGVVRVAFTRCAVKAGRVDRIEGPVAGDTRGQVRIGYERTVKGNQISQPDSTNSTTGLGIHSRSVGGFAVNLHICCHDEGVGATLALARWLPAPNCAATTRRSHSHAASAGV